VWNDNHFAKKEAPRELTWRLIELETEKELGSAELQAK